MIGIGISRYNLSGLLNQEKALVGIAGLKNLFEDPLINLVMPVIVQTMSSDTVPRIITDHIQTEVFLIAKITKMFNKIVTGLTIPVMAILS